MSKSKTQSKPLSVSKLLEDCANATTLIQAIGALLALLATVFASQAQPNSGQREPSTQLANPSTVIHIHPQPGSDTIIKVEQINSKLNNLSDSEDNNTLDKAKEAMSELQQLLQEKKIELEQGRNELYSFDIEHLTTEQIKAREEIQDYLLRLQVEIAKLDEIKVRIEGSQEAIVWLDPTQEEFLQYLAKKAGDAAFASHPELKNPGEVATLEQNLQQFYWDIEYFLQCIHTCLTVCRPNILDTVIREKELPISPLPFYAYVSAFEFIRDKEVPSSISGQTAQKELTAYLDYLINILA